MALDSHFDIASARCAVYWIRVLYPIVSLLDPEPTVNGFGFCFVRTVPEPLMDSCPNFSHPFCDSGALNASDNHLDSWMVGLC